MDDLERRLRTSLATRADDVDENPQLWGEVQDRRARSRRRRAAAAVVATAAAVAAAVAVPALLPAAPPPDVLVETTPTVSATSAPTVDPTATAPVTAPDVTPLPPGAGHILLTDGRALILRPTGGGPDRLLTELLPEGESEIVRVAVRPGSTAEDLTATLLVRSEGMWDLRWIHATPGPGRAELRSHADAGPQYDISERRADADVIPTPVWSPDGRHLAWLERSSEGSVSLRTIGWDEGPGTGRRADDNAGFELPIAPVPGLQLEDWTWLEATDLDLHGLLAASADDLVVRYVPIGRQGDRGLALTGPVSASPGDEAIVDLDATHQLRVVGGGEGTVELQVTTARSAREVPDELESTSDVTGLWLQASGETVLIGNGARAWLIDLRGRARPLDGAVAYADLVG